MLEELGLGEAPTPADADVVVFNTCTIREKPDTKLAAYLGEAAARKRRDPDRVIAVGGCYAEAQRERIFELYPDVDVAFGPGSIAHLGDWLGAGGEGGGTRTLRARRPRVRRDAPDAPRAAVPGVGAGVDGLQLDVLLLHRPGRPRARAEPPPRRDRGRGDAPRRRRRQGGHAARPERQLVGPRPRARTSDTEFGELLRACDAVAGIERIRFTSPHPKDFRDPVIAAIAECDSVCEHVHLPLQSGSSRVLKAMRRTYTRERYLELVEKLRATIPDLALRHRHHRRLPRRDRPRLRGDARGGGGGRLRQRLHVRLLAAPGHRGGRDGRTGAARAEDRAHGAARRADAADCGRAERRAHRPGRAGARRGAVAHRREPSARTNPAQHDRELHRHRSRRRARRRPHRAAPPRPPSAAPRRLSWRVWQG